MREAINHDRRRFLGTVAMTITTAQLSTTTARAETNGSKLAHLPSVKPGTNVSFASLKQIDAGVLNVGYAEAGPIDGPPVVLLHGWPYDIHTYVDVAPVLASAGYRVVVPYLRGYGTTRFVSAETLRNGEQAALALDVIALMDALQIEKAIVAGCDWGARTADIIAALRKMILVGTAPRGREDIMHLDKASLAKYIEDPKLQGYALLQKIFFAPTESSQAAGDAFIKRLARRKGS